MKKASITVTVFLLSYSLISPVILHAQKEARLYEKGEECLLSGQFDEAKSYFAQAENENTAFRDLPYKLAITTLLTASGDDQPLTLLTSLEDPYAEQDDHFYYWLGQVLLRRYQLDDAIAAFEKFNLKNQNSGSKDEDSQAMTEHIRKLRAFFDHPDDYEIRPLDSPVNSPSAEMSPVYFEQDGELLFTSNRGNDGEKSYHVYFCQYKADGWTTPKEVTNLGAFSRANANVEVVNDDGKLFLFREDNGGDLYFSQPSHDGWMVPAEFDARISNNNLASHFFINTHEDRILFAASTERNGLDIYESFRDPKTGKWSRPAPFTATINSPYDEDSPYLTPDEKTLYFCSKRPDGIGGFDVYVSHFNATDYSWSIPQNLGWPINSPNDEFHFKMSSNQSSGYFISNRLHTQGDYDIYFFWHVEKVKIEGHIFDNSISRPLKNAEIRFHPSIYRDEYFTSPVDPNGHYSTTIIANEHFDVEIIQDGKVLLREKIETHDTSGNPTTHLKDFIVE